MIFRTLLIALLSLSGLPLVAQNVPPSFRAPGWTEYTAAGTRDWTAITASDDGSKLAATVNGGKIWTSDNGGATWTERTATPTAFYTAIASSADGQVIAAVATSGQIQVSTDGGATWNGRGSSGRRHGVGVSSDGTQLVTAVYGGSLQRSVDSGTTWNNVSAAGTRDWFTITLSGGGSVIVGGVEDGQLHVSTDSGTTWNARASNRYWIGLTASSDGSKLAATSYQDSFAAPDGLYLSTDSGTTWTKSTSAGDRDWRTVSMSSDGSKLVAVVFGGEVHTSTDSGATWAARSLAGTLNWRGAAMSRDGSKCAVAAFGAGIHAADPSLNDTITVAAGSGVQTVANFITDFDAGTIAGNPAGLPIFSATDDNNALFTSAPNFTDNNDGTATLDFTPGAGAGTAIVTATVEVTDTVTLMATETSAPHRFRITLTAPAASADLSSLTLSAGTLSPTFSAGTLAYTTTVTNPTTSIQITPTVADGNDTVTVNGQAVVSGAASQAIPLGIGNTVIPVVVTDVGGVVSKSYQITVTRPNAAPTDVTLSNSAISENTAGAVVGELAAVDLDPGQTFTFTLVAGLGSGDNSLFEINGNQLKLKNGQSADFEVKAQYSVRVQVSDGVGGTFARSFVIGVTNRNEIPSFTKGADPSISHTTAPQTVTNWATAINDGDSTVAQTLSFTVTEQGASGLFTLLPAVSSGGILTYTPNGKAGTATFSITLRDDASINGDAALTTAATTFTITITAVAPSLSSPASPTSISSTGAVLGGSISGDGGTTITERGIVIALASDPLPAVGGPGVVKVNPSGSGTGFFSVSIPGLLPGTAYQYRTFATNSAGTTHSAPQTFTTLAGDPDLVLESPPGTALPGAEVSGWGRSRDKQLESPGGLGSVIAVAAGYTHSLALKENGTVAAWGGNVHRQIDVPSGLTGVKAVAAGSYHSLILKSDNTVVAFGRNHAGQSTVPAGLTGVIAISAGAEHSVALKSDGTLAMWGSNAAGQSTAPGGLGTVSAIAAGGYHTLALAGGQVRAWGSSAEGQTTVPTAALTGVTAIAAGAYHSLALKDDGSVVAWGAKSAGQSTVPAGLSDVIAIAAGAYHSLALKEDGSVVAWGWNHEGQGTVPSGTGDMNRLAAGYGHNLVAKGPRLVFADEAVPGTVPADPKTIVVKNSGTSELVFTSAALSGAHPGDFALVTTGITFPATVLPGTSVSFTVDFKPTAEGARRATLTIRTNDPNENPTLLALSGTGLAAAPAPEEPEEPEGDSLTGVSGQSNTPGSAGSGQGSGTATGRPGPVGGRFGAGAGSAGDGSIRPDLAAGTTLSNLTGVGERSSRKRQISEAGTNRRGIEKGYWTVANLGTLADELRVSAPRGARSIRFRFRDESGQVSARIFTGRYETPAMDHRDAPKVLIGTVAPGRSLLDPTKRRGGGKAVTLLLKVTSTTSPHRRDEAGLRFGGRE